MERQCGSESVGVIVGGGSMGGSECGGKRGIVSVSIGVRVSVCVMEGERVMLIASECVRVSVCESLRVCECAHMLYAVLCDNQTISVQTIYLYLPDSFQFYILSRL